MTDVTFDHFLRAAVNIGAYGDNDTLPFDIDVNFVKDNSKELANIAFTYFDSISKKNKKDALKQFEKLSVTHERLLVPTGSAGFRITTKISPFWNIYFNGLGISIAEKLETKRSPNAHSYRYIDCGDKLFNPERSWRSYKQATLDALPEDDDSSMVVQTDISSFYEHIYHHRLENCVADLFGPTSLVALQVDRLLSKFASGRSFGLPVGGQCARILAETLMDPVDKALSEYGVTAHRYVDDFILISSNREDAYGALSILSHILADYGLSLNRSKTTILKGKHYRDYVNTQLNPVEDESASILYEMDLRFDPYSDTPDDDFENLKTTVKDLRVLSFLQDELGKTEPDKFVLTQVSRTLRFQGPEMALGICEVLLAPNNLHAFKASWSSIMRGVVAVRGNEDNNLIFDGIDELLDKVIDKCRHLLLPDANCIHFLKAIRFRHSGIRATFLRRLFNETNSYSVKKACIECWGIWKSRSNFLGLVNNTLRPEEQRMLWAIAGNFDDEGFHFRKQNKASYVEAWKLGVEKRNTPSYSELFMAWVDDGI